MTDEEMEDIVLRESVRIYSCGDPVSERHLGYAYQCFKCDELLCLREQGRIVMIEGRLVYGNQPWRCILCESQLRPSARAAVRQARHYRINQSAMSTVLWSRLVMPDLPVSPCPPCADQKLVGRRSTALYEQITSVDVNRLGDYKAI